MIDTKQCNKCGEERVIWGFKGETYWIKEYGDKEVVNEVEVKRVEWQYGDRTYTTPEEAYKIALYECFDECHEQSMIEKMIESQSTAKAVYFILGEMLGKNS